MMRIYHIYKTNTPFRIYKLFYEDEGKPAVKILTDGEELEQHFKPMMKAFGIDDFDEDSVNAFISTLNSNPIIGESNNWKIEK